MSVRTDPVVRRLSGRFQVSLVWEGCLVGLAGGLLVTLYRLSLTWAEGTIRAFVSTFGEHPERIAMLFVGLVLAAVAVAALVRWEPATSGSGIPQVDAEVMGSMDMPWHRVVVAKLAEGTLAALGGLSLGREGPSVQLGGMAGKAVSKLLRRGRGEERLLVTCGAGAGMAAAFHAPLTGVMFALEEIHKTFNAALIISVMCAAVVSDYVASQILGLKPVIAFGLSGFLPHGSYWVLVVFGLAMGLVGVAHNAGMFAIQDVLSRIRWKSPFGRFLVPFVIAGGVALSAPILMDGGDAILKLLEQPTGITVALLATLLISKFLFTGVCFGAGVPGGTLFPLVVMGALAGALLGEAGTSLFGLNPALVTNFMVLGIAGMFASAIRAPVTAVVLAFELTGSLDALLSLSVVSVVAYVTANVLHVDPYYEHLLAKLLGLSEDEAHDRWGSQGRQLHSYVVESGCDAAGRLISELDWPKQALIVTVTRCGKQIMPRGSTRLMEGDRLLVLLEEQRGDDSESHVRRLLHGSFAPRQEMNG